MSDPILTRRALLKGAAALAAAGPGLASLLRAQSASGPRPLMAYVGTYRSGVRGEKYPGKGKGEGIYIFQVDRVSGSWLPLGVFHNDESPSCLAVNPAGTRVYAANSAAEGGTVSAYAVDRTSGQLIGLGRASCGGSDPAYLSVHPSGRWVFTANYGAGSVSVMPVKDDGSLGAPTDIKTDVGRPGPTHATHAAPGSFANSGHDRPHAHMILSDPSGRFVLSADLGLDRLMVWKFDSQAGRLSPGDPPFVPFPPGDGTRHFAFHPKSPWLYSLQEEGSTLVLFDWDAGSGRLARRQTISTLPPGFAGTSFASELAISADGRFLYVANRLHDGVSIFFVGSDGTLALLGEEWTRGDYPRSFAFDPSGRFLSVCNQHSDNITIFRVDAATGGLAFTGRYVPVGQPSSVVFVDLA